MRKLLFTLITMTFVQAQAQDNLRSYEDIVRELSGPNRVNTRIGSDGTQFEKIRLHAQVGGIASRVALKLPSSLPSSVSLGGVEAVLGIDLFSPRWIAEGALRSYNPKDFADSEISMKEFDLRVVHQVPLWKTMDFRWGIGMSARYLSFSNELAESQDTALEYTTPASVFLLGAQTKFSHAVGLTAELAYRSRLVSDTVDRNSIDGSIRISGSF